MKNWFWLILGLWVLLAACAPRAYPTYEPGPYERPWWTYHGVPPLPVSPEQQ